MIIMFCFLKSNCIICIEQFHTIIILIISHSDPEEMPHNMASGQGFHRLLKNFTREHSDSVVECFDSRPKGRGFKPHRCHCVVVLEQDKFILA